MAVSLGIGGGYALAMPPVPKGAEQVAQSAYTCEGTLVLKYTYNLPNGDGLVVFKEPNKDPKIWVLYDENENLKEAWVGPVQFTSMAKLTESYPDPCSVFKKT